MGFNATASRYPNIGDSPVISPEVRAEYRISRIAGIQLVGGMGETIRGFDTPEGQGFFPVQLRWIDLGYRHDLIDLWGLVLLSGSLGIGLTSIGHEEMRIPLGAAGISTLSANSETSGHFSAELAFSRPIIAGISAAVGSNFRLLTPVASMEAAYSVFGGLTIEIF